MKKILAAICISLSVHNASVANGPDSILVTRLSQHLANRPIEQLYVHHDRSIYQAGDTVWMKIYQTISPQASSVSRVAYIDLINSRGTAVSHTKLPLENGTAYGQLALPGELPDGTYHLRA